MNLRQVASLDTLESPYFNQYRYQQHQIYSISTKKWNVTNPLVNVSLLCNEWHNFLIEQNVDRPYFDIMSVCRTIPDGSQTSSYRGYQIGLGINENNPLKVHYSSYLRQYQTNKNVTPPKRNSIIITTFPAYHADVLPQPYQLFYLYMKSQTVTSTIEEQKMIVLLFMK